MAISGARLTPVYAAALALALPASAMAASEASTPYDCSDGRKLEVFQPKDGVMEARADDLVVQILVKESGPNRPAHYSVQLSKGGNTWANATTKAAGTLPAACRRIASYYKDIEDARNAPSAEELREQLSKYYSGL